MKVFITPKITSGVMVLPDIEAWGTCPALVLNGTIPLRNRLSYEPTLISEIGAPSISDTAYSIGIVGNSGKERCSAGNFSVSTLDQLTPFLPVRSEE